MPRTCTVCAHERRSEIDSVLLTGGPLRTIADRWSVSKTALIRHREGHLPAALAMAKEAEEVARADALLTQVRHLQSRTLRILDASENAGELRTALAAIREARGTLELLAKLLGEIDEAPRVNVLISAEWTSIRAAMVDALAPYPEARSAVAEGLLRLEAGQ